MTSFRIALANLPFPVEPAQSVQMAVEALRLASAGGAEIVCFPECFVPGYRGATKAISRADPEFLEWAWSQVADTAKQARIAAVLGTERVVDRRVVATTLIVDKSGECVGF